MLDSSFFDQDAEVLAKALLGKVLQVKYQDLWLQALIIETEAYYLIDKASHASLGYTSKRKALFMPGGTIYMYYARGYDSLNISAKGAGNAVLIKAGIPYQEGADSRMIDIMQTLNPQPNGKPRAVNKLCSGQTLLCKSLGLKVVDWDQQIFHPDKFYLKDIDYRPDIIIKTRRLGIASNRDPHLLYRFIDYKYADYCTSNPLRKEGWILNQDYFLIKEGEQ